MSGGGAITRTQHEDGSFTVEGWRENGWIQCPRCGEMIRLIEDVEEYEVYTGKVTCWGPGTAECCGLAIICTYDGDYVIDLSQEEAKR